MSNFNPQLTRYSSEEITEGSYDRPAGVSIFAVLFMLGGAVSFIVNLFIPGLIAGVEAFSPFFKALLVATLYFLSVISIAAGIGTWKGKKWGWWLALFYFAYTILGGLNQLISYPGLAEAYGTVKGGGASVYAKAIVKIVLNGLVLAYYFRESVVSYFHVESVAKLKALGIVFGIGIVIFAVCTLTQLVAVG
ncbi:hypothetical protein OB236_11205 [Paenibacillus sp. WQ 127069]|uniref:Yip1 domain-containing protein n=1 Tax=Paenibacillus baimaensis TaxID=2982185 RepID=A0ABT2UFM7_9BACL|nr:hypothetical protein [Paenibacillus sp. WQ 127069]MCU6792687.1 hypothetical protein [Paenibacillus sp. WQ 127069]